MAMQADAAAMTSMPHCDNHHSQKTSCNNCFFCHLHLTQAIRPTIGVFEFKGASIMAASPAVALPDSPSSSFFHPPRTTSV